MSVGVIICPARQAKQHFKANPIAVAGIILRHLRQVNLNGPKPRRRWALDDVDSKLGGSKIKAAMGFAHNRDGRISCRR